MIALFEQEYAVERYGDEQRAEGMAKGMAESEMRKARETAFELRNMGLSVDNIAKAVKVSVRQVQEWFSGKMSVAK